MGHKHRKSKGLMMYAGQPPSFELYTRYIIHTIYNTPNIIYQIDQIDQTYTNKYITRDVQGDKQQIFYTPNNRKARDENAMIFQRHNIGTIESVKGI